MSLKGLVQSAARMAIHSVGDLAETATYTSRSGDTTYDPDTDTTSRSVTVLNNVPVVLTKFTLGEVNSSVEITVNDQKILVAALDLPGIVPDKDDELTMMGSKWLVEKVLTGPGSPVYGIHLRKSH